MKTETKQEDLKIRKFHLKNTNNNFEIIFTHYQITSWPDGDRPI